MDIALHYKKTKAGALIGHYDANRAGDQEDHCFIIVFMSISWLSKKQVSVALSTTEAEAE